MQTFQNILVVRTDRIGDVVLTTPALSALRRRFPAARITVLIAPSTKDILDENPDIDEILLDDRKGEHTQAQGFWGLVKTLRQKKFDLAIIFHTKNRTNLACFLAGIPTRIGYKNNKLGFLLTRQIRDARPEGKLHEARYCLELLKDLGVDANHDLKLIFPLKYHAEKWADKFFGENDLLGNAPVIAIHPGASCVSKRWPPAKFRETIGKLEKELKAKVILVGGDDTKSIGEEITGSAGGSSIVNLIGRLHLSQLASVLKRCQLLISNDSGPVHVAVAVGTPVISIFGRNQAGLSPVRWKPLGPKDIVLHKEVGCVVCLAHNCNINFKCLEAISAEEVVESTKKILK